MECSKYLDVVDNFISTLPRPDNFINNDFSSSFGDFIFQLVKDFYDNGMVNNLKPKNNEWSVYASIVLQNKDDFKVIIFTNGTKSLPHKNFKFPGLQIYDCHAEILAIRALKQFLIKCLIFNLFIFSKENEINLGVEQFMTNEEFENFSTHREFFEIFDLNCGFKNKISRKENVFFHLYISEFPCGDCSIYPINKEGIHDYNQTGSKTIQEVMSKYNSLIMDKKFGHDNTPGQFRTKSMRNDISKENISFTLSCSDKLMLRNILGVQGKHLSSIINKICFSSITLSYANSGIEENSMRKDVVKCITRGISILRRNSMINLTDFSSKIIYNEPTIYLTSNFINPSESKSIKNEKNALSFSAYWYYGKNNFSKIDQVTGFKQGVNLNTIIENKNEEKFRVDISRLDIFKNYINIFEIYSKLATENEFLQNLKINQEISKINKIIPIGSTITLEELNKQIYNKKYKKIKNKILEDNQSFLNLKYT